MSGIHDFTLASARDALKARKISAVELTNAYIDAIERLDGRLNSFITRTPDLARESAKAADAALAKGEGGKLCGIPLGIKDLFCTRGVRTTAASKIIGNFVPPYESTVTSNLLRDGAVFLGKLNLDEFAMGSANLTSAFGPVENPWKRKGSDAKLVPGGSSGGSAAAVAAGLVLGATGTDTGGSIRQPAAFTGIAGVKPTYGRCSRFGTIAFASSLDQAGPMARNLRDCAIMLESMAGFDARDSTSVDTPVPNYEAALSRGVKGLRVGIPREYHADGMPAEIEALWQQGIDWLRAAGAEIVDISLPHTKYGLPTYYIAALAEASSNLARYDGVRFGERVNHGGSLDELYEATRAAGFGDEVKRRILIGTHVLSSGYYDAYYLRAQKVRTLIQRDFLNAYENVDVILTPTAPSGAFAQDEKPTDPVQMYLNDIFTVPASMAGVPALSVPAGLDAHGVPLGLQLIGKFFDEETLLAAGHVIEQAASFNHRPTIHAGVSA
ncbi:Asp-tRNA(Asn)/Glu-tRNA(Gln) amidotransferase subunit GatA [Gluconobacter wancherniae]|uniref:Glutamyl-tRNA(Gln) amidotransferase subunit A n=1 Tax=Gluconobacter wancherniae NBRC 103581 TaxID=656744 RepID=A0A511B0J0_9PROT|nr:Asp-tRNA(Asn)/Glu-tRNA(Gln) amidotransferase subunit GatA [Gluconobacter wancherniae]MBF0853487.1 Asp-tRNA(Asn)/Glu-tRNA(Gln) amidotransferase subunit GatA [Gluconobacter wancherniae]GBD55770.1 glutamyl-tRNA(Gln) amidotransferase subunit A [Gluconobacter wancherniae NBRC 103581]GBR66162.1 amidotransferase subunit alpha [Gluconobacter wancherniae NBRC 103581]GEK93322.1 glutamyl-tRNA(Gln) amidotransferase subunit A [Gluconobacter wancherniae NBRC 103581]